MPTPTEIIETLVQSVLEDEPLYFCVGIAIKPTNNIKVFVDGDTGVSIDTCVRFNRRLRKIMEEQLLYPEGDFSLEVSSPGVDAPLQTFRQYVKNIGRNMVLVLNDGTRHEGALALVAEESITLTFTEGKGKTIVTKSATFLFHNIKTATVQTQF